MQSDQPHILPEAPGLLRRSWPAFLVLFGALGLTLLTVRLAQNQVDTQVNAVFETQVDEVLHNLASALDQQLDVLRSLQGLYTTNIQVVRDVFELFATVPAEMHESVKLIAFAPHVTEAERPGYEAYARNQGVHYFGFSINPGGPRSVYYPLEYLVPFETNSQRLGFDLASDQTRAAAITQAVESGEISATTVLRDVPEQDPVFLLIAPLFEDDRRVSATHKSERPYGVCILELVTHRFIGTALEREREHSPLVLRISDGGMVNDGIIYEEEVPDDIILSDMRMLTFAGHHWTVEVMARPALTASINTSLPLVVLLTGAVVSFLLFGFVLSLSSSRLRAIALADRMTRSLRRIVESSTDIIGSTDLKGNWKTINSAAYAILGYTPEELIDLSHEELVHSADRGKVREVLRTAHNEKSTGFDARYRTKTGEPRWISWNITRSERDREIYCIGRDITARIAAEEAITIKNRQLVLAGLITDHENIRKQESIREQNIQYRMQLTSVIGFLQLILTHKDFSRDELIDFVAEADRAAAALLANIVTMTEVELRRIEDVTFDLRPVEIAELVGIMATTVKEHVPELHIETASLPEALQKKTRLLDIEKIRYATDSIVELLRPGITGGSQLQLVADEDEGTVTLSLHTTGLRDFDTQRLAVLSPPAGEMRLRESMDNFSYALLQAFLEIMNATVEIAAGSNSESVTIRFVFDER